MDEQQYNTKLDTTVDDINRSIEEQIGELMQLDETGKGVKDLATHARGHYMASASDKGIDPRTGIDQESVERAIGDTFGFAPGENPSVNGAPVIPFEKGMKQAMMQQLWDLTREDDFVIMNEGGYPLGDAARQIEFDELKDGMLFYKNPGVYQVGVLGEEGLEMVIDSETGLPYEFDYLMIAEQLKDRLHGGQSGELLEQLQYESDNQI